MQGNPPPPVDQKLQSDVKSVWQYYYGSHVLVKFCFTLYHCIYFVSLIVSTILGE